MSVTSGALTVDAAGLVLSTDAGAAALLDVTPAELVGTNFFAQAAPATRVPAFFGRFLEGVRSGRLHEDFTFVLGAETGALELSVALRDGEPGRYLIRLVLERAARPSRQREAMLAVDQRSRAEPVDPRVCEQEPIHVPGTIQAHGALLAVASADGVIEVVSENLARVLAAAGAGDEPPGPGVLLGRHLRDVLPDAAARALEARIAYASESGQPSRLTLQLGAPPRPYMVAMHPGERRILVEFEALPVRAEDYGSATAAATHDAVRQLRGATTLSDICARAARLSQEMTGYERVLVYRFDADWNGEALGEALVPGWGESLLGLRFPSSDIPRQARELYTRSPSRFVIDRDAAPVPLAALPTDNGTVDLSQASLRTLSPVHIEYQRNLGVNGSMSVAIMVDGRLWGLLIGHHRRPHYVPPDTRDALAVVADALALRIHDMALVEFARRQEAYVGVELRLLQELAGRDDYVDALTEGPTRIVDLFGASGAAVVSGEVSHLVGVTPDRDALRMLVERLRRDAPDQGFVSSHLESFHPGASAYREVASGLLAVFVDSQRHDLLLWFRPEVAATVVWSGDPTKPVVADPSSAAVLPRRSFERWVEERRGFSDPWAGWEMKIARTLVRAVAGMALRQTRRTAELSAKRDELMALLAVKDQLIRDKDLLTREIDHRVKNSLQIVSAFLSMQARRISDPDAQQAFSETYGRVMSIARVHDSLYQAEDLSEVDLGQTIENLCRDLAGMGGEQRELALDVDRGLMVPYRKAVALSLIATELVTNAWKYAYPGEPTGFVEVLVRRHDADGVRLTVCDQGGGLPEDWESRPKRGLGMQLIRAMLKQIDATMEVSNNEGACFTVRC